LFVACGSRGSGILICSGGYKEVKRLICDGWVSWGFENEKKASGFKKTDGRGIEHSNGNCEVVWVNLITWRIYVWLLHGLGQALREKIVRRKKSKKKWGNTKRRKKGAICVVTQRLWEVLVGFDIQIRKSIMIQILRCCLCFLRGGFSFWMNCWDFSQFWRLFSRRFNPTDFYDRVIF